MKILKTGLESLIEAEIVVQESQAKRLAEESARIYLNVDRIKKACGIPITKEMQKKKKNG